MYSVVLMMAMSGGADAVDFGRRGCSSSCSSSAVYCTSAPVYSHPVQAPECNGSHSSCSSSCSASCGNGHRFRLFGRRHHRCGGGSDSCSNGNGYGNGYACSSSVVVCGGGGVVCGGGVVNPPAPPVNPPAPPVNPPGTNPPGTNPPPPPATPGTRPQAQINAPATILVHVPAGAVLTIDGARTVQTSSTRTFTTPALSTGVYTFSVAVGDAVQTRDINVVGGRTTEVNFSFPVQVATR